MKKNLRGKPILIPVQKTIDHLNTFTNMERPQEKNFVKNSQIIENEYIKALENYVDYLEDKWEPKTEMCPHCEGKGWIQNDEYQEDCTKCDWTGRINID